MTKNKQPENDGKNWKTNGVPFRAPVVYKLRVKSLVAVKRPFNFHVSR